MTEYRKKPGDRLGLNWMIPNVAGKRAIRHVIYDSNFWKSFIHARLAVALGDKGNLTFYGRAPLQHQLIAEHLTAEYRVKTAGRGRIVDEWKIRPQHNDNHFFDCLTGCAVCASMLGATLPEFGAGTKSRKVLVKLSNRRSGSREIASSRMPGEKIKLSEMRNSKR